MLVTALVLGVIVIGCGNGAGSGSGGAGDGGGSSGGGDDNGGSTNTQIETAVYGSKDDSNNYYFLAVTGKTDRSGYTIKPGDTYEAILEFDGFIMNGYSIGTVESTTGGNLALRSSNGGDLLNITITGGKMTSYNGTTLTPIVNEEYLNGTWQQGTDTLIISGNNFTSQYQFYWERVVKGFIFFCDTSKFVSICTSVSSDFSYGDYTKNTDISITVSGGGYFRDGTWVKK